jgi:hypothetical protein
VFRPGGNRQAQEQENAEGHGEPISHDCSRNGYSILPKALDWPAIRAHDQDIMILDTRQILSIAMLVSTAVAILFWSKEAAQLMRMLQEAIDNFRGRGPRPPMHPMPANDAMLLNKRQRKNKQAEL